MNSQADRGRKIPTKISVDHHQELRAWGFSCENDDDQKRELFKILLDDTMFNAVEQVSYDAKSPQNQRNVDRWSLLYIRALIGYAMAFIGNDLSKGSNNEIQLVMHCVLTTPTTWNTQTLTRFSNIAEQAISQTRQSSEARVYNVSIKTIKANITEPEALASLVLHSQVIPFKHGDRFLVLDIGGATSDLCFFQVQNIYGHHICLALKRENPFRGISKGCMDIDRAFHLDIYGRLCTARIPNPSGLATQMSRSSEYRAYKADTVALKIKTPISVLPFRGAVLKFPSPKRKSATAK